MQAFVHTSVYRVPLIMQHRSTTDHDFLETARQWIEVEGEIMAITRYPNRGGSKDFDLENNFKLFNERLTRLEPSTSVIICKGTHLPLRGRVDEAFIRRALKEIPEGEEWLVLGSMPVECFGLWYEPNSIGDTRHELEEELRSETFFGQEVYAGILTAWWEPDHEAMISAYVPNPDGTITPAAY